MTVFTRQPEPLLNGGRPLRVAANEAPPYRFAYARTALKYGLMAVGCQRGDVVLVPEFVCTSVLEPFSQLALELRYYPVSPSLEPEWDELPRLVGQSTVALLVVHYFGQPQVIERCKAFCRTHSLLLIEDNAHGYGATSGGLPLGAFGDIGVASPRKSFPIRNGAYLFLAHSRPATLTALRLEPPPERSLARRYLDSVCRLLPPQIATVVLRGIRSRRKRSDRCPSYWSQEAFREPFLAGDFGMDDASEQFLSQQDFEMVRCKRQQIYKLWEEWVSSRKLTPVFSSLSCGAMPLVFAAYAETPADARDWYRRGHRAAVDIHSWPTLPREIVECDGQAMRQWERMVCFPIHQEMNLEVLKRRLASL